MDERIAKLPTWARELIKQLEKKPAELHQQWWQASARVQKLESDIRRKNAQIQAMIAFFQCAAKGENEVAKAVQSIVEDFLSSDETEKQGE